MKKTLKVFRSFAGASKAAGPNRPIAKVSNGSVTVYIVGIDQLTEFAVLGREERRSRTYEGHIIASHLVRLGNGNWAEREPNARSGDPTLFDTITTVNRD